VWDFPVEEYWEDGQQEPLQMAASTGGGAAASASAVAGAEGAAAGSAVAHRETRATEKQRVAVTGRAGLGREQGAQNRNWLGFVKAALARVHDDVKVEVRDECVRKKGRGGAIGGEKIVQTGLENFDCGRREEGDPIALSAWLHGQSRKHGVAARAAELFHVTHNASSSKRPTRHTGPSAKQYSAPSNWKTYVLAQEADQWKAFIGGKAHCET
jgi:hypothetical protein